MWVEQELTVSYDNRAAESTEEVRKLRPVRLIQEDGIIRPYDQHESEGYDLFQVTAFTLKRLLNLDSWNEWHSDSTAQVQPCIYPD